MSDPTTVPDEARDGSDGTAGPATTPQEGGVPRTDVESAPALQERDAGGDDTLT